MRRRFLLMVLLAGLAGCSDTMPGDDIKKIHEIYDGTTDTNDTEYIDKDYAQSDADMIDSSKVWSDSATSLMWQKNRELAAIDLDNEAAETYCNSLILSGYGDWRLPTISELRTLIKGCSGTQTGGACNVKDDCVTSATCWVEEDCICNEAGGPGEMGYYWQEGIWTGGGNRFWSSSITWEDEGTGAVVAFAWYIVFSKGGIGVMYRDAVHYKGYDARCVRNTD